MVSSSSPRAGTLGALGASGALPLVTFAPDEDELLVSVVPGEGGLPVDLSASASRPRPLASCLAAAATILVIMLLARPVVNPSSPLA